jgi:hypothetical protein
MRSPFLLVRLVFASWALVFGVGCDGGDGTPPALDEYFTAEPYSRAACNAVDQRLTGTREVHLFVHGNFNQLLPITQGLARYYHRHGLSFVAVMDPEQVDTSYALDTNETALNRAMRGAFPGVDLNNEAALMADPVLWNEIQVFVINFVMRPLIDFAGANAAGQNVTNLLLLPDLERPGGTKIGGPGTTLAGLSVSPALLAEFDRMMTDQSALWQDVSLPQGFTPMLVLGNNVLKQVENVDPDLRDLVAAHEFGHSAALVHTEIERNLMYPSVSPSLDDCTDSLNDTQLATMRTTLNLGIAAAEPLLAAAPKAGSLAGFRASFKPAHLRAFLAGDRQPLRALIDRLFHSDSAVH